MGYDWTPAFEVGEAAMDGMHHEFVELLSQLLCASDADFAQCLQGLREHMERHFAQEDALMQSGDYASAQCHLDEHKAVLESLVEVQALVVAGNLSVGRRLARELGRWFPEHTISMDKGLATWAEKRRLGGVKLQFMRRPVQTMHPEASAIAQ